MSITIDLDYEVEHKIRHEAERAGIEPDVYVINILTKHIHKQTVSVSAVEADLLQQINLGLSAKTWQRYNQLREKLEDYSLQPFEQQELIHITDQIEQANVRRVAALFKLAEIRNTTVDGLMDELKIRPPAYYV